MAELGVVIPPKKARNTSSNIETWQVCWTSRKGVFSGDTRPEITAFSSREEANEFAEVLRESYRLLRHTSDTNVSVKKH